LETNTPVLKPLGSRVKEGRNAQQEGSKAKDGGVGVGRAEKNPAVGVGRTNGEGDAISKRWGTSEGGPRTNGDPEKTLWKMKTIGYR